MAAVGMKYIVAAPIATENLDALPTYGTGVRVGRAISSNVTLTRNENDLYADDVLAESDNSITGGTLDITVAEILDEVRVVLFGDVKGEDDSYSDSGSSAPYIGLGYLREQRYKGKSTYQAVWLHKVQLSPAEDTAQTKSQSITWGTQRVTGDLLGVTDGPGNTRFRRRKTFDSEADAITWLNTQANYTPAA